MENNEPVYDVSTCRHRMISYLYTKKHKYYCIEFNFLSSFHSYRQTMFYLTAFGDVSTNGKAPKLCNEIVKNKKVLLTFFYTGKQLSVAQLVYQLFLLALDMKT